VIPVTAQSIADSQIGIRQPDDRPMRHIWRMSVAPLSHLRLAAIAGRRVPRKSNGDEAHP
jgi:hypothetical protein